MVIYTLLVDPENSVHVAFFNEDPDKISVSCQMEAAVGMLVCNNPGVKIDNVWEIDWKSQIRR